MTSHQPSTDVAARLEQHLTWQAAQGPAGVPAAHLRPRPPTPLTARLRPGPVCRCGKPARGEVGRLGDVPAHFCRQCADHCELTAYLRSKRAER